ncbi:uncharacterized protein LOC144735777 isoform X1 [Lampetra planeri]
MVLRPTPRAARGHGLSQVTVRTMTSSVFNSEPESTCPTAVLPPASTLSLSFMSVVQELPWEASDPPSRQEAKELKRNVSFARRAATEALRLSGHSRGDQDGDQDGDGFHKRVGSTEENGPGPNNDPSVDSLEEA